MRKQISGVFNAWDCSLEAGQRVIRHLANEQDEVIDLYQSTGWGKRERGELSYRRAKKPHPTAIPVCVDGVWYWRWKEHFGA